MQLAHKGDSGAEMKAQRILVLGSHWPHVYFFHYRAKSLQDLNDSYRSFSPRSNPF